MESRILVRPGWLRMYVQKTYFSEADTISIFYWIYWPTHNILLYLTMYEMITSLVQVANSDTSSDNYHSIILLSLA